MSSWYYKRSIGDPGQKHSERNKVAKYYRNVGLVVRVTGIAGSGLATTLSVADIPGGPWKIYGVARSRLCPSWRAKHNVEYIQCDVANHTETYSKQSPLTDITHVFYLTWSGSEDCPLNSIMFRNILDSVNPNAPNLKHISLLIGIKYYLGNFPDIMSNKKESHDCPFYEDLPRLTMKISTSLEDTLWEVAEKKKTNLVDPSPRTHFRVLPVYSLMNIVSTFCVYAAICKHENKPLVYTGTKESLTAFSDAVDANLLAEHLVWTATDPKEKNQAFNCTNADVFSGRGYEKFWGSNLICWPWDALKAKSRCCWRSDES